MPFFDYRCTQCDHRFEALQKVGEPALTKCPSCDQDGLEKLLAAPALQSSGAGHVHGPGCNH